MNESRANPKGNPGLWSNLVTIYPALGKSKRAKALTLIVTLITLVTAAMMYAEIRLVRWNKPFFNALSRRDLRDFLFELGVFFLIASMILLWTVALGWLGETLKIKIREALVLDLVHRWMRPGCASTLAHVWRVAANPVQRIHEDVRNLTDLSVDLGVRLLQASMMAMAFLALLWDISDEISIRIAGHDVVIRGYMVWVALAYSILASLLGYWVGGRLRDPNAELSAREAEFNRSLAQINENRQAIGLATGEGREIRRLEIALAEVLDAMRRVVAKQINFTWVTGIYNALTRVAPTLAGTALYFTGKLSFGGLLFVSLIFVQLQTSLRWFVDNFYTIGRWSVTLGCVASFRRSVIAMDAERLLESGLRLVDGGPGSIVLENISVAAPSGNVEFVERRVEICAGEHVVVVTDSSRAAASLLHALAGLSRGGSGKMIRPREERMAYVPRTPYLPESTLLDVLAYPLTIAELESAGMIPGLLGRMGMERLIPLLDSLEVWESILSGDETHCIALARAILRKPRWLLIDHVLELMHQKLLDRILGVFGAELPQTGIIYIGSEGLCHPFFTRVLHTQELTSVVIG